MFIYIYTKVYITLQLYAHILYKLIMQKTDLQDSNKEHIFQFLNRNK